MLSHGTDDQTEGDTGLLHHVGGGGDGIHGGAQVAGEALPPSLTTKLVVARGGRVP